MSTGIPQLDEWARVLDAEFAALPPERQAEFRIEREKCRQSVREFFERVKAEAKAEEERLQHPRGDS